MLKSKRSFSKMRMGPVLLSMMRGCPEKRQNKETWVSKKGGFVQDKDFCPVLGVCSDTNLLRFS